MSPLSKLPSFVVACLSGWLNDHQEHTINYLTDENRVIRESDLLIGKGMKYQQGSSHCAIFSSPRI